MKTGIPAFFAGLQCFFLAGWGILYTVGVSIPWYIALFPLWASLGLAVLFWGVLGALQSKFGA